MPQFLSSIPLFPGSYPGRMASRKSTDSNDLLCNFYNLWAWTAQNTQIVYFCVYSFLRKRVYVLRVTTRIVIIPLLLHSNGCFSGYIILVLSKHTTMANTKRLILYKEIRVVHFDNSMKHKTDSVFKAPELFIPKLCGIYSNTCSLKDK
jgi:hypothetical protein